MLNLPISVLKTRKNQKGVVEVFDNIRKKYVVLTPEENVRQHFINFLITEKGFPSSLIAIEKGLLVHKLHKRFDAVAYNNKGKPIILMEFKSPKIKLSQSVFEQISAYNIKLKVKYLIISNGNSHYCCSIDYNKEEIKFLNDIPSYKDVNT